MCAIVDADVADQVFGRRNRPEAGVEFFRWLNAGSGRMVTGGGNWRELCQTSARAWMQQAVLAGRIRILDQAKVDARTSELRADCVSNDAHVVALAQISGARLLYTNDGALHQDFRNKTFIDQPRGRIYSTKEKDAFDKRRRTLLSNKNLCRSGSS